MAADAFERMLNEVGYDGVCYGAEQRSADRWQFHPSADG
jgi:hypothetical protein